MGFLIESSEKLHPLLVNFVDMAKEDIQFWISKFVAEAKRKDGTPYPPNSLYQIYCGLGCGLTAIGRSVVDIFNAPKFALFQDVLDSCMKQLKASSNFGTKKQKLLYGTRDV